ncbi:hypothetical protein [Photorhabdus heterorhabditis]|uniref:hypothetical protein n=1 Tax=Photorhabdus heterorhabditis TaxID=880156 RepID=UPI00165F9D5E|nr:hypothetical protein [Photorhabdus heterorhabditis]
MLLKRVKATKKTTTQANYDRNRESKTNMVNTFIKVNKTKHAESTCQLKRTS